MKLKPGNQEEYERRHDEIWPELKQLISASGISDYYIFLDKETDFLFAVQTLSGNEGSQDLATVPIVQKWWKYMADIMETNEDDSPVIAPLKKVFYLR